MHFIARTQEILMFMSSTGECKQQKHTQHSPSMKMECDYLNGWIKNGHMRKNLTQNSEPKRSSWGTQKKQQLPESCKRQKWMTTAGSSTVIYGSPVNVMKSLTANVLLRIMGPKKEIFFHIFSQYFLDLFS